MRRSKLAEKKDYRTVTGVVQFDPRPGDIKGKQIRNIAVQQAGFGPHAVRVSATLWPSHKHVKVDKGDVVTLEGTYSQGKGESDGKEITYHNISVLRIKNHGSLDGGRDDASDDTDELDADDLPF